MQETEFINVFPENNESVLPVFPEHKIPHPDPCPKFLSGCTVGQQPHLIPVELDGRKPLFYNPFLFSLNF